MQTVEREVTTGSEAEGTYKALAYNLKVGDNLNEMLEVVGGEQTALAMLIKQWKNENDAKQRMTISPTSSPMPKTLAGVKGRIGILFIDGDVALAKKFYEDALPIFPALSEAIPSFIKEAIGV